MRRLRLTLEYDGTDFLGWQMQPEGRCIQGVLEEAVEKVTQQAVRVTAAGRTDAGVHARGQVAHLDLDTRLSAVELRRAFNSVLPYDLAVRQALDAPPDFHARFHALGKSYRYRILNRAAPSPLRRRSTWHLRSRLDLDAMRAAAGLLVGEHDFAAYRGTHGGAPEEESTLRTLDHLDVAREGDELHVWASGRSFLRYMVRNLVGTLVEVGQGRRAPESPAELLSSGDRAAAAPTAPPLGLCLERVIYPGDAAGSGPEFQDLDLLDPPE
jgi:tRNA pseudouridine38-40 synthase